MTSWKRKVINTMSTRLEQLIQNTKQAQAELSDCNKLGLPCSGARLAMQQAEQELKEYCRANGLRYPMQVYRG